MVRPEDGTAVRRGAIEAMVIEVRKITTPSSHALRFKKCLHGRPLETRAE